MTDHEMPPLPKRLPKRLRGMTLERYNFLLESFWGFWHVTGGMSPEDAEAEMNAPWFFSSWEPRIDRMMEDDGLAARVQRSLHVGLAEGDPAIMALAETPEGVALLAQTFPKLPTH
jgi:hypothetical protein